MFSFKQWINEAFSTASADRVHNLIRSYLEKKLGGKVVKMPGVEEFSNSIENGFGIRYFYGGTKSVRFNWSSAAISGMNLHSVDVWDGTGHDPQYHIKFEHDVSIVKVLPSVIDVLLDPSTGAIEAIPVDNLNEDLDMVLVMEMAMHDIWDEVLKYIKVGQAVRVSAIESTLGSRGYKIINAIRAEFADSFEQRGRNVVFKGDPHAIATAKDKILTKVGGVKMQVTKGGTNDTVKIDPKLQAIEDAGIEKVAYEDQLKDLSGLIKLVVKGASNALFIAGRGGVGKALAHGTGVLTPSGFIPVEEIQVGDTVIAQDGTNTKVTGVFPQGTRDVYDVTFADGRSATVDGDHLWEVNVEGDTKVLTTLEIINIMESRSLDRRITIPLFEPDAGEDIDLPIDPYLLGILIGDGCLSSPCTVAFTSNDQEIINEVTSRIPDTSEVRSSGGIEYRICIKDRPAPGRKHHLGQQISNLGLNGRSFEKFIPGVYKNSSLNQKLELLAGLLDSDGYIDTNSSISFTTTSPQLASDVQEMIWSIGGRASVRKHPSSYKKDGAIIRCRDAYTVSISYCDPTRLFKLPRKLSRVNPNGQYLKTGLGIQSIKPNGAAQCTCIRIDHPRSLFVIDDYVVTHNTHTVETELAAMGLRDGDGYFKNTGSASAIGIYKLFYKHRDKIILFDDSDGALADQDSRNIFKAATDTKKNRKLVWNKESKNMVDPDQMGDDDDTLIPKYFEFTGRIIFISNLSIDKLDPDGALRTRALMISIDPTDEEVINFMEKIVDSIPLEDGLDLDSTARKEVVEQMRKSTRKGDVSIRKLVRGLNMRAALGPGDDWVRLVKLYA